LIINVLRICILRGTPNAYEMDEGCNYENHPFLSDHGIST
jgi:hypothetical protein